MTEPNRDPEESTATRDSQSEPGDFFPPGCGLWLGWMLVSTIGTGMGWAAGWQVSLWGSGPLNLGVYSILLGLVVGLIVGLVQMPLLSGTFRQSWLWPLASGLGWAVGFPLGAAIAQQMGMVETVFGVVLGAVIGGGGPAAVVVAAPVRYGGFFLGAGQSLRLGSRAALLPAQCLGGGVSDWRAVWDCQRLALLWLVHRPVGNRMSPCCGARPPVDNLFIPSISQPAHQSSPGGNIQVCRERARLRSRAPR